MTVNGAIFLPALALIGLAFFLVLEHRRHRRHLREIERLRELVVRERIHCNGNVLDWPWPETRETTR